MKKALRIVFIVFLMLSAIVTFAYVGLHKKNKTPDSSAGSHSVIRENVSSVSGEPSIALADGDFAIQVGQSHQCTLELNNAGTDTNVIWSSTDSKIVSVDDNGRVTGISPGDAEIIAVAGQGLKARSKISVFDNYTVAAEQAINALASDGSDESIIRIKEMTRRLGNSGSPDAEPALAALKAIMNIAKAGATGSGDVPALCASLKNAAKSAGMDSLTENSIRRAALLAYCQGEKISSELIISFTGDCTFGRFNEENTSEQFPAVYKKSGSATYPFDLTKQIFAADDVTMINLECALTNSRRHKNKEFYFRGDPSYVNILTKSSVEAVTVENNHSFDYYDTGFNDTIDALRDAGIRYTSYYSPAVMHINGVRVVMLSLCMINSGYTDEIREHVENCVNQYKQSDTVIIMNIHWGQELEKYPLDSQIKAAHAMIDAGVDLIIGHHPHILQGAELYKGHYIFYSLGNFSFGGNTKVKNPQTVILRAMFGKDGNGKVILIRLSAVPCLTTSSGSSKNNYRPIPIYGSKGEAVIEQILSRSNGLENGIRSLPWHMIP